MAYLKNPVIISSAIIIIIFVVFITISSWQTNQIAQEAANIQSQKSDLNNKISMIDSYSTLKSQSAQAATDQVILDAYLPPSSNLINFPTWLSQISQVFNVSINFSFGSQSPPMGNNPGNVTFNLVISGATQDAINFLKAIEANSSQFLISLSKININSGGTKENPTVTITVAGELFFR